MKLIKNANGKNTIKMTGAEWLDIGEKSGWTNLPEIVTEKTSESIKLVKQANGKLAMKISRSEWTRIGKEAGWWDNVKQVGKGIGQGVQGAWNAGAGAVSLIGNLIKGVSAQIKKIRENAQQGQVQQQEVQQLQTLEAEIQQAIQEANSSLQRVGQPQSGI